MWDRRGIIDIFIFIITEEWDKAQTDFFESFRNYDEAGSPQRIQVLKWVICAPDLITIVTISKYMLLGFDFY